LRKLGVSCDVHTTKIHPPSLRVIKSITFPAGGVGPFVVFGRGAVMAAFIDGICGIAWPAEAV
jgi:hypothetical protein